MSLFPEYDETAGFPLKDIEAFKCVARRNRMVISSRELNPLCTDLMLDGYASKGFHIKAKTCDWGPMAGFVPTDERFTKAGQSIEQQRSAILDALSHGSRPVPLAVSATRLDRLHDTGAFDSLTKIDAQTLTVSASPPAGGTSYDFVLTKRPDDYWAICYAGEPPPHLRHDAVAAVSGHYPVTGLSNPSRTNHFDVKAAVCGDYDLWCVFPHSSLNAPGVNDRMMSLRATLVGKARENPEGRIALLARKAGLTFDSPAQMAAIAAQKEDQHLGNVSATINRIRSELNASCRPGGAPVVMHSDYGGNPFGSIDYPIIFFIPIPNDADETVAHVVARDLPGLQKVMAGIRSIGYRVEPNPAWAIPSFVLPPPGPRGR